jgi:hypothetical protein
VTVVIEPEHPELAVAASLEAVIDIIGRRARDRGLAEEKPPRPGLGSWRWVRKEGDVNAALPVTRIAPSRPMTAPT